MVIRRAARVHDRRSDVEQLIVHRCVLSGSSDACGRGLRRRKHAEAVPQDLLRRGADPDYYPHSHYTCAWHTSLAGCAPRRSVLGPTAPQHARARRHADDRRIETVLMRAALNGDVRAVEALIAAGADVDLEGYEGYVRSRGPTELS